MSDLVVFRTSVAPAASKESQAMAQKFPYLNITQVGSSSASPGGSSKPLLTVKPNSQLLKPGVSGGSKAQVNIAGSGKVSGANTKAGSGAAKPPDYKASVNKLALFKAQVFDGLGVSDQVDYFLNICR